MNNKTPDEVVRAQRNAQASSLGLVLCGMTPITADGRSDQAGSMQTLPPSRRRPHVLGCAKPTHTATWKGNAMPIRIQLGSTVQVHRASGAVDSYVFLGSDAGGFIFKDDAGNQHRDVGEYVRIVIDVPAAP